MPGIYSGLLSVLFAALATPERYGTELHSVFEAMEASFWDNIILYSSNKNSQLQYFKNNLVSRNW